MTLSGCVCTVCVCVCVRVCACVCACVVCMCVYPSDSDCSSGTEGDFCTRKNVGVTAEVNTIKDSVNIYKTEQIL